MPDVVIDATGLGKSFGAVHALQDLDLQVRGGESVAIFGRNGAGKTTLMRILAGLLLPTRGQLRIFGQAASVPSTRREVGLVNHGSCLYRDLTAGENLEFYGRLFGLADLAQRVEQVLIDVDLQPWRDRAVRTFSRGMEQRLALARAFLHEPSLLLLDEPYSGLDPQAAVRLQEILMTRHAAGSTIVLTTHDLARGLEVCDHAILLESGLEVWHSGRFVPGVQEMTRIYEREIVGG
jgi:heme exporter protein A